MTNKDLLKQYVDTGLGIPRYQFDKLPNDLKKTYLRKMEISIDHRPANVKFYYGTLPEDKQLAVVNRYGFFIEYINNPSEEVKLVAVKQNALSIEYINNPSEQVQLAVVNRDGFFIQYINNPSEQVQLAAVKEDEYSIRYIRKPSQSVKDYINQVKGKQ